MIHLAAPKNYRSDGPSGIRPDLERETKRTQQSEVEEFGSFNPYVNSVQGERGTYFDRDHWNAHYTLRRKKAPLGRKGQAKQKAVRQKLATSKANGKG